MNNNYSGVKNMADVPKILLNKKTNTENMRNKVDIKIRRESEIRIFYIPCFNKISKENYKNTVLNKEAFDSIKGERVRVKDIVNKCSDLNIDNVGIWAFKEGKINNYHYNNMNSGDIILFLIKDKDGYQCIDSIGYIGNLFKDNMLGSKLWNDESYKNFVVINELIKLNKPFKLSLKRKSCASLEEVPIEIFHSAYEMFRQWNLNKKDKKNKLLPEKYIEEVDFITKLINVNGGSKLYGEICDSKDDFINETEILYCDMEEDILKMDIANIKCLDANISIRKSNEEEKDIIITNNRIKRTSNNIDNKLSQKSKNHLGMIGEEYIYMLLKYKKLLDLLGLEIDDIDSVEWYNQSYKITDDKWEDKSVGKGHDIKVNTKDKSIYIEVKTSFNDIKYYNVTRNELITNAKLGDDYYIVKVMNMKYYDSDLKNPNIIVIKNPLNIFLNDLSKIKEISLYL
ncbi:TPA: DUF3883 domain-containing protein [Clostridioides difficile]|nr:DUF3883 domain-containing protein [Clostridioides difficile]